ncbi:hypothetical protein EVAR_37325_1 [Eumeta japonica]|uniref:Uncharacterized protein n=1 Tax=Eumeta variegata TaxID=151549 RepID=A0A4C1WZI4_EUMVA|nr:hypothetical protein EVAR_37325_1 [Eumeta japonica]
MGAGELVYRYAHYPTVISEHGNIWPFWKSDDAERCKIKSQHSGQFSEPGVESARLVRGRGADAPVECANGAHAHILIMNCLQRKPSIPSRRRRHTGGTPTTESRVTQSKALVTPRSVRKKKCKHTRVRPQCAGRAVTGRFHGPRLGLPGRQI